MLKKESMPRETIAQFLTRHIALCGKTQKIIAREIGYTKPNIITMFKQGLTKLPIDKIGPLAHSLDIDPVDLLRRVMGEYLPQTWSEIEKVLPGTLLSEDEQRLLKTYRDAKDAGLEMESDFVLVPDTDIPKSAFKVERAKRRKT